MKLINSLFTAIGMYSKIPVPKPKWKQEYMDYVMCFFPLVGIFTGISLFLFWRVAAIFQVNTYFVAAVCTVLPIWISGGIHMDGYMDTADALASYGSRERRLEILKDSHVGAFAVIRCVIYILLSFGAFIGIHSVRGILCICTGFVISRSLSGLSVAVFPKAKKEGSLVTLFADAAKKQTTVVVLVLFALAGAVSLVVLVSWKGLVLAGVHLAVFGYYYWMSKKQFGGITGDLAGYFLQMTELAGLCTAALLIR